VTVADSVAVAGSVAVADAVAVAGSVTVADSVAVTDFVTVADAVGRRCLPRGACARTRLFGADVFEAFVEGTFGSVTATESACEKRPSAIPRTA
jgi:hypothetical protein